MFFRTKQRAPIPVRRYGPGQLWEERHPVVAALLLLTGAVITAAAIYRFW